MLSSSPDFETRPQPFAKAHVLAIDVQVDEAPQRARVVPQAAPDRRIARLQLLDQQQHRRRSELSSATPSVAARSGVGMRTRTLMRRLRPPTGSMRTPCSAPTPATSRPPRRADDLEDDPAAIVAQVGAANIGHDAELLAHVVDHGLIDQIGRET